MRKLIGGTFLIAGTAIGGGVVLLPAIIGMYGYFSAMAILIVVWLMNYLIGLVFLEANFYLPQGTSFISMTNTFFGKNVKWVTWILSLLFLYTLLCAYLSGISEIFNSFFHTSNFNTSLISIFVIGIPIFFGVKYVSAVNDLIVIGMFILILFMFSCLIPQSNTHTILSSINKFPLPALPIVFTAFGFSVVFPSLRIYFNNDAKQLKQAFLIGSIIPLIIYIIWTTVVMGVIPGYGDQSFQSILSENKPIDTFKTILILKSHHNSLSWIIEVFILTAFVTSFIGISLALYDFLADGLNIRKNSIGKFKLLVLSFLPPFIITMSQNNLFIRALGFAGLLCTILFGIFPILFVMSARYKLNLISSYKTIQSKPMFLILLLGCGLIIGVEIYTMLK